MAQKIITSLTLQSPTQTGKSPRDSVRSAIKNVKRGGMRAKDKMRLTKALESLPGALQYLRKPIVAIAEEDQDMLGTGDVDTTLLAKALEQQNAAQPSGFTTAQAQELEQWLRGISSSEDVWAAPVWFVLAFLAGHDMFGGEK